MDFFFHVLHVNNNILIILVFTPLEENHGNSDYKMGRTT